jgi:lactate dehydrogenase-like 2-hydroxyacid dehydrogenase
MSQPTRVLQLVSIGPLADRILQEKFSAIALWRQEEDWTERHGAGVEVVITSVRHGCDADTMSLLPALRGICSWGVGHDTIDVVAAHQRRIQVSNTPGVLDDCVADMAWALMLDVSRRVAEGDRYVRAGKWMRLGEFPLGRRVSGKRIGLLGMGRIGRAIAKRGLGFDMKVRYHTRTPKSDLPYVYESSLAELAAWADYLVVACVGGPSTQHLVDRAVLNALGPQGILVNIARGNVVDQDALVDVLQTGVIGGAGLDVLQGEPGAPQALMELNNVVVTPHIGSATYETRRDMEQCVIDNLDSFLRTGKMLHLV